MGARKKGAARRQRAGNGDYYAGSSPIHGRGLFAGRDFRRGDCVGVFEGRRTRTDGTHVLWVTDDDGDVYGVRGNNELRFLNHASKPNAEFEGRELYALRRIRRDEEITIHYGADWDDVP